MRALAVYHFVGCPYCTRVREAERRLELAARGVSIAWRDVDEDAGHLRDLLNARGRRTVPVLRIEREGAADVWMPESLDIVAWLEGLVDGSATVPEGVPPARGWLRRLWPW